MSLRSELRLLQSVTLGKCTFARVASSTENITLKRFKWRGFADRNTSQIRAEIEVI